jgi:phosphatidylserine decarboxylase
LAAPCDGKLSAYKIDKNSVFYIKRSAYTLANLLQDESLAKEFTDGTCLIFRLTPDDYHRYAFIDGGEILAQKSIKGVLHTVRPISQGKFNVFTQNSREYAVLQTENFGKIVQMEVGALCVGRITNLKNVRTFKRGDEKGWFEFGGSTIIMLFKKDAINLNAALFDATDKDGETVVKMGARN